DTKALLKRRERPPDRPSTAPGRRLGISATKAPHRRRGRSSSGPFTAPVRRLGSRDTKAPMRRRGRSSTAPDKRLGIWGLLRHPEPRRFLWRRERPFKALKKRLERPFLL
ncbi:hypothetical protein TorRG33x02_240990, partial [Trema orientale]